MVDGWLSTGASAGVRAARPARGLPLCLLSFLTAWWLDAKGKSPRRTRRKLCCILFIGLGSHITSLPLLSKSVQIQGEETRTPSLGGEMSMSPERKSIKVCIVQSSLENPVCHQVEKADHLGLLTLSLTTVLSEDSSKDHLEQYVGEHNRQFLDLSLKESHLAGQL